MKPHLSGAGLEFRRPVPDMDDTAQLEIAEGVLLGHAMVHRLAEGLGIRAFFIKGPGSVLQGLRAPRISADVDVFVPPSGLGPLLQALQDRGWRERPVDPDTRTFPRHSVTVDHAMWPCCIDIHFRFPGMEKPALDCFEAMWVNTNSLDLAGQKVRVPSKALGILILALHSLRSPESPSCRQELEFLSGLIRQRSAATSLLDIAEETGSLAALRPFLEDTLPKGTIQEWPEPSKEWRNRVAAREPGSARLLAILQAPLGEKPLLVWRAVFPRREVLLSKDIYADMSFLGRVAQHRARWARFLQALPRVVSDIRRR